MDRIDGVEALRRRLYRPGATEEDRRRYATAVPPEPEPAPEAPPRRANRGSVVLAALVTVVVAASGIAVAHAATRPAARPIATATPRATASIPALDLAVGAETPVHGTGTRTVALDVTAVSLSGGAFTVLLSAADERPSGWRAIRLESRRDWSEYPQVMRSSPARDRRGATRPDVFEYRGDAPRWIQVQAASDQAWTLSVSAAR